MDGVTLGLAAAQIGVRSARRMRQITLLRAVAGLERPSAGRIRMDGRVLDDAAAGTQVPPEARRIGMVFQDYALFPHLSVADNVAFGVQDLPRAERSARGCSRCSTWWGWHAAKRAPHQLSGGQQQRIALARALAPRPQLLLLDEPFSNLDVDLRERLAHEVRGILKDTGTTALFVTHDQLEAFALGDVIGVMQHGRLEQWDEAYALYHRPATRFVAQFIGHGVFTPAHIDPAKAGDTGGCVHTVLGAGGPAGMPAARGLPPAATATCCCAPTTSCTTTPAR